MDSANEIPVIQASNSRTRNKTNARYKEFVETLHKRKRKVRRVSRFSPILKGLSMTEDTDVTDLYTRNHIDCKFSILKVCGQRLSLHDSSVKARKQMIRKVGKLIRRVNKKRNKDSPTLEQAKKRPDWHKFEEAIRKEYQQMVDEGVYEYIKFDEIEKNTRILGAMIVLQI